MNDYESKDYWAHIHGMADDIADRVRSQDGHLSDVMFEETDGTEWSIYTHRAGLAMTYTDNQDALMERFEDLSVFKSWGSLVSAAAASSIYEDVADYYNRNYTEHGEKKEK
tara:strand:+ start:179 stop:511 length:333 start_codon:yes stop_codon:yes gene_type:complete